jgi:flagellar assembly protein FliH
MSKREFARILRPGDPDAVKRYALHDVGVLTPAAADGEPDPVKVAYEQGVLAGEARVREETGLLLEQQNRVLTMLVQEVRRLHDDLLTEAEDLVAGLALTIAEKIIREQVQALPNLVVTQVREAVARVRDVGAIRVEVHPDDVPLLHTARERLEQAFDGAVTLQIEPRVTIARGGCQIETPARVVDARLEAQLLRLGEALRGRAPRQ